MKKVAIIITLFAGIIKDQAQNFTAVYSFSLVTTSSGTVDPTPVPTAANVSFGSFTAHGVAANPNAAGRFSFTGWPQGSTNNNNVLSSFTGTVDTSKYYKVVVTPATNYSVKIDSIRFTVQRSGTGIRTYKVFSSKNASYLPGVIRGGNQNLSVINSTNFYWNYDSITTLQNGTTIIPGASHNLINSSVSFLFTAYNSEAGTGTFSIDNVTFYGSAFPTPLTAAYTYGSASGNGIYCTNSPIQFTDSSFTGAIPINSWSWDFGDSTNSIAQNPSHSFTSAGCKNIKLIISDANGNQDSITKQICVNPSPVINAVPQTPINGCVPQNANFSVNVSNGGPLPGFSWNFGPATVTNNSSSMTYQYQSAGTFSPSVVVTNNFGCKDSTGLGSVTIYPNPVSGFSSSISSFNPLIINFTNSSSGAVTYLWNFGDGNNSVSNNPTHNYSTPGIYTVCLVAISTNACTDTFCTTAGSPVGIHNYSEKNFVKIYPNPVTFGLELTAESVFPVEAVEIIDVAGRMIKHQTSKENKVCISTNGMETGAYFIKIRTEQGTVVKRFIIRN